MQRFRDIDAAPLLALLEGFGLRVHITSSSAAISGSYWGGSEAGLRGRALFLRPDTPIHSILHEAAHYVCASPQRRATLDTDAGGDDLEECAVCYLQVKLAETLPGVGQARMFAAMDAWGYSFRLGSARRWFAADAEDARGWLFERALIDADGAPTGRVRGRRAPSAGTRANMRRHNQWDGSACRDDASNNC